MENGTAEILALLANPARFTVLGILAATPGVGVPAGELAARCNVTSGGMSQHLALLKLAGFVISREEKPRVFYYIAPDLPSLVMAALAYDAGREA